jgi:AmiR/NasT family two-component response regulator
VAYTPPDEDEFKLVVARRTVIGQAQGILMERYKITADEAFDWLAQVSQASNRKLFLLASRLADSGEWPYEYQVLRRKRLQTG